MKNVLCTIAMCAALQACGGGTAEETPADDPMVSDAPGGDTGDDATLDDGTGDTTASDEATCEGHTLGDACVDEAAFAACQEASAECPGQVQVLESCPLQFACP